MTCIVTHTHTHTHRCG